MFLCICLCYACVFSMFMSNYAYVLFHGLYVLSLVLYQLNRSTSHVVSSRDHSYDDGKHRERLEHH